MPIHLIAIDGCDYYSYAFFDASNSWRIHLLDGTNIFEGILQEEEIEDGARDVGISIAEYKRMLKSAFAGEKTELVYDFSIKRRRNSMELHWKRVSNDTKFRLGIIPISYPRDPNKSTRRFLSNCYRSSKNDKAVMDEMEEKYSQLLSKHEDLQKDLDTCNSNKETLLADLVSKFVLVINEKKSKVRKLQEKLSVYEKQHNQNKRTTCSSDKSLSMKDQCIQVGSSTKPAVQLENEKNDDDEDAMLFRSRKRKVMKQGSSTNKFSAKEEPDYLRYTKQQRLSTPATAVSEFSQDTVEDANDLLADI